MAGLAKLVMRKFYRKAEGRPERLPWHQEDPPKILLSVVANRRGGRALDVGCGAGVFSVWLAEQGMDVTGIDLFPEAIAMAEARAREHAVKATFVMGDLFDFAPQQPFACSARSGGGTPPRQPARRRRSAEAAESTNCHPERSRGTWVGGARGSFL
ncbi:MAG TPA: methyltransferase domain-containing protein, partial [Thermoanaerobaculia bacterium]|nr:methyltransferase domain-containing protein [Thermoanaerobaculia bacterium]